MIAVGSAIRLSKEKRSPTTKKSAEVMTRVVVEMAGKANSISLDPERMEARGWLAGELVSVNFTKTGPQGALCKPKHMTK